MIRIYNWLYPQHCLPSRLLLTTTRRTSRKSLENELDIPERPKKPLPIFLRFLHKIKPSLREMYPDAKHTDLLKLAVERWRHISVAERAKIDEEFRRDTTAYRELINKYENDLTPEQTWITERRELNERVMELGKPKLPVSAFLLFVREQQSSRHKSESYKSFRERISYEWAKMDEDARLSWKKAALAARNAYYKDLAKWEEDMEKKYQDKLSENNNSPHLAAEGDYRFLGSTTRKLLESKLGLPKRPKRPMTPFLSYFKEIKPSLVEKYPDASYRELMYTASQQWKQIPLDDRTKYDEKYSTELAAYRELLDKYEKDLTPEQKRASADINKHLSMERKELNKRLLKLGMPKKPPNPFILFLKDRLHSRNESENFREFQLRIGREWANMDDAARSPWTRASSPAWDAFYKDMNKWEENMEKMVKDKKKTAQTVDQDHLDTEGDPR